MWLRRSFYFNTNETIKVLNNHIIPYPNRGRYLVNKGINMTKKEAATKNHPSRFDDEKVENSEINLSEEESVDFPMEYSKKC